MKKKTRKMGMEQKSGVLTVIDLFSGAGGMSEGCKVIAANEIDPLFSETYKLNHPDTKVFTGDIKSINIDDFKKVCGLNGKKIDIIIGGPPCQGFSMANRQRFIDDPRNILYKYFIKFVKYLNPTFVVMENVKGIVNSAPQIAEDFKDAGYTIKYKILNAKNYGLPQNRERVFFVGIHKGKNFFEDSYIIDKIFFELERNRKKDTEPLSNALWGLRNLQPKSTKNNTNEESEIFGLTEDNIIPSGNIPGYILRINKGVLPAKVYNHKARYNNKRDIEIFRRLPQGGKSDHPSISDIMPYKRRNHIFKDKFFKLPADIPSKTITAHMKFDCNMYIHPLESRGLTPREAARIQSFPDDYRFLGPFTKWYAQIGNAVPPLMAAIIAKSIIKAKNI